MKWVSPGGPADLNGMLTGDHIIEVDGVNVVEMSHHEVSYKATSESQPHKTLTQI